MRELFLLFVFSAAIGVRGFVNAYKSISLKSSFLAPIRGGGGGFGTTGGDSSFSSSSSSFQPQQADDNNNNNNVQQQVNGEHHHHHDAGGTTTATPIALLSHQQHQEVHHVKEEHVDGTIEKTVLVSRFRRQKIVVIDFSGSEIQAKSFYDWKDFVPKGGGLQRFIRWMITGSSRYTQQSDEDMHTNLGSLARMLLLLREYERKYGVPEFGGPQEQRKVMSEITKELYNSGAPIWALETVMQRVAEGISGREGVQIMMLPHRCFIYYPAAVHSSTNHSQIAGTPPVGSTDMFELQSGFDINKMGQVERVAVRLASFASNTRSAERISASAFRMPEQNELVAIEREQAQNVSQYLREAKPDADQLAEEILDLASSTYGLFFFLNSRKFQSAINATGSDDVFWDVPDSTRDIFTRLATNEATESLRKIREEDKVLYSPLVLDVCRILSSAGACALWFDGSMYDMLVSGLLAVAVAEIGASKTLAFEERILSGVASTFFVGLVAGLLAIHWPDKFCFGAIAVASCMELMQGFKVVYAVIEIMSKNAVAGTAKLLEGILVTGLVSYGLKFGLDMAIRIIPAPYDYSNILVSAYGGISRKLFPLILPFAATAWSALFRPSYSELSLMAFHGMLASCLYWAGAPLYLAAMCVTFSAGIISRFTGREALGNTLAGLYALVPGTYMVRTLLSLNKVGFLESVLTAAATIGVGGWAGTILCSPTILGKTSGFHGWSFGGFQKNKPQTLLYF